MAEMAARQLPKFRLGTKQVFMPNYVVTLLRNKNAHQDPHFATFQVPLRFTKFDLRDYLWNLYGLEVSNVRSWVKLSNLARRPFRTSPSMYRPQSKKFMLVEMARPFAFPEGPDDREAWNKALWDAREKAMEEEKESQIAKQLMQLPLESERRETTKERKAVAEMAKKLLSGEMRWENGRVLDEKWVKNGEKQAR